MLFQLTVKDRLFHKQCLGLALWHRGGQRSREVGNHFPAKSPLDVYNITLRPYRIINLKSGCFTFTEFWISPAGALGGTEQMRSRALDSPFSPLLWQKKRAITHQETWHGVRGSEELSKARSDNSDDAGCIDGMYWPAFCDHNKTPEKATYNRKETCPAQF